MPPSQSHPAAPYAPDPDSAEVLANLVEFGLISDPFPSLPSPWHEIAVLVDYVRPQGRLARLSAFIDAVARFPNGDRIQAEVDALRPHTIDRSLPDRILYQAREALHQPPPIEWALEGLLARPSLNLLVGSPGAKKTISAIDLAVCAALGKPWLGFKTCPRDVGAQPCPERAAEPALTLSAAKGNGRRRENAAPTGAEGGVTPPLPMQIAEEDMLPAHPTPFPLKRGRAGDGVGFGLPVLYVDEEVGLDRFWSLLHGVLHAHNAGIDTPLDYICLGAHDLRTEKDADELTHRALKRRSRLIIIDTLSGVMRGGDENTVNGVGPVLFYLRRMAEYCRAAVLVLHHTNRSGFFRGSSALAAGVDLLLSISSAPQSSLIEFRVLKSRHAAPPPFYANAHFEHVPSQSETVPFNRRGGSQTLPFTSEDTSIRDVPQAPASKSEIENRKTCPERAASSGDEGSQIENSFGLTGEQAPLPPGEGQSPNRIWLTLADPGSVSTDNLDTSSLILKFLHDFGEASYNQIVEAMPLSSPGTIRNSLHRLMISRQVIRTDGGGKGKKAIFALPTSIETLQNGKSS